MIKYLANIINREKHFINDFVGFLIQFLIKWRKGKLGGKHLKRFV